MTANQYLRSIGLGPVNPVCTKCKREVGRVWTVRQECIDCLVHPRVRRVRPTEAPSAGASGKPSTPKGAPNVRVRGKGSKRPLNICVDCTPEVDDCDSCYESDCDCNLNGHRRQGK